MKELLMYNRGKVICKHHNNTMCHNNVKHDIYAVSYLTRAGNGRKPFPFHSNVNIPKLRNINPMIGDKSNQ